MDGGNFALLSLFDENGNDVPHILLGCVVVFSIALNRYFFDELPLHEVAQVHVHISATHAEHFHNHIGIQRIALRIEKSMDLRHGFVDAPGRGHLSPQLNKLLGCLSMGFASLLTHRLP